MNKKVKKAKSNKIKLTKKIIFLLLLLLLILLAIILNGNKIKNKLIPVYTLQDRTSNVEKYKKKYKNSNVIGWIKVQGTNIDIPIINYTQAGKIDNYAWMYDDIDSLKDYMPIFGHNIRNVATPPAIGKNYMNRFEQLMSFVYSDFADENKYIQLTINGKNYLYQIYGVSIIDNTDIDTRYSDINDKNKDDYIKESINNSLYKYNVKVSNNDYLISLITCTRLYGRTDYSIKVDGKLVKNSNKGYNYDMHEKKNYKEIKKILEGDGEDV